MPSKSSSEALVFVPVLYMQGLAGSFFRPLGMAYLFSIGTSMLIALTVTLALCLILLPGDTSKHAEPGFLTWLKGRYGKMLPAVLDRPRAGALALVGLLAVAAVGFVQAKDEFLPNFRERDFLMHWVEKPGTSLEAMIRITVQASKKLRAIDGVQNFGAHIGRAEVADEVVGPNFTENWISVAPDAPLRRDAGEGSGSRERLPRPLPGRPHLSA